MKTTIPVAFVLAVGLAAIGTSASAQNTARTAAASFQVQLKVLKNCTVAAGSASDIRIGSADGEPPSATDLSGSNTFNVTCTNGTPYTISLKPSEENGGTDAGTGNMVKSDSTTRLGYALYQNQAMNTPWGGTSGNTINTKTGTGTGNAQPQTVWAKVTTLPAAVLPGDYADRVTITVTY